MYSVSIWLDEKRQKLSEFVGYINYLDDEYLLSESMHMAFAEDLMGAISTDMYLNSKYLDKVSEAHAIIDKKIRPVQTSLDEGVIITLQDENEKKVASVTVYGWEEVKIE